MSTHHFPSGFPQKVLASVLLIPMLVVLGYAVPVRAVTMSDLQQQQAALRAQAEQAELQAQQQKTVAQRAAESLQQVSSQITTLSTTIQGTNQQISTVQDKIAEKDQEIARLESQERSISDQSNALIRALYKENLSQQLQGPMAFLSDQPTAKRQQQEQEFSNLKRSVAAVYAKTQAARAEVEQARAQLNDQSQSLVALRYQQQGQQATLADVQSTQQALKSNAVAAETALEAKAAAARAQAAQIQQKINLLSVTASWGNGIVSSNDSSWYYTQSGDYTRLGSGYETVNNVGCLITSIAMVATYYGHHITPDYIATHGSFSYDGYLIGLPNTGVTAQLPGSPINWSVVNNEIANNRPVIVSIYLPSIGAINSDGSSHFIVIKGQANGKYLMHDPVSGQRSYSLNQVRSMVLVRPN